MFQKKVLPLHMVPVTVPTDTEGARDEYSAGVALGLV
jgi:hypothetical protein